MVGNVYERKFDQTQNRRLGRHLSRCDLPLHAVEDRLGCEDVSRFSSRRSLIPTRVEQQSMISSNPQPQAAVLVLVV